MILFNIYLTWVDQSIIFRPSFSRLTKKSGWNIIKVCIAVTTGNAGGVLLKEIMASGELARSVTIAGWIFISLGIITLGGGVLPLVESVFTHGIAGLSIDDPVDLFLVLLTRLLAVAGGVFLLYGFNWARWLLVVWMAFHIVISMEDTFALIIHGLLFAVIVYFLYRPPASAYLRPEKGQLL